MQELSIYEILLTFANLLDDSFQIAVQARIARKFSSIAKN